MAPIVSSVVPEELLEALPQKCSEGLMLAMASDDDGAVMVIQWCNKAFCSIMGYTCEEAIGQRGTILIGADTEQGTHLLIIDRLMKWERFTITTPTNRKNGDRIRVQMNWTPLSDSKSGNRWWLGSLIEVEEAQPLAQTASSDGAAASPMLIEHYTREVLRLKSENKRLHELARTVARESNEDPLTGLSNRRHFEEKLKAWLGGLRKGGTDFAILYVDLDRFKAINDSLGHDAGDRLLVSVSEVLRSVTDQGDLIARIGGDEFIVLKPLGDSALSISSLADDIVRELGKPFKFEGKTISSSASVGVAIADAKMKNPDQVVADADKALYQAKKQGRGRWSFFTAQMHEEAIATKQLAAELLVACDRQEFVPFFQPLINAETGQIASAEVLVRWEHPSRGLLVPDAFLGVAETMGIVNRIDEIVFARLRETLAHIDAEGVPLPRVAINVSAGRLEDTNFIHDIRKSGICPSRLTVEILESVYLEQMGDRIRWALDELHELGVTVAVDDFGTGHASVQGLLKIKPSVLKIDRQFLQPVVECKTARDLLQSIVDIGKSLNTRVVAEGVETEAHARIARDMGCDYLQGYYFGRPMDVDALSEVLLETGGLFWQRAEDPVALARRAM
ncbi:EAL domain-containing protein [Pacificoceanicola onchidii]|uniref:sensor domain-containing protein n=1 Tax=Pacificoceanicola onchidii TaxID=2562685 RepID=UPI0010A4EC94|nr:EAL domain-containing protein [Pacificoceanicola onchidii]